MSDPMSFWARRRAAVKAEEEADLRAAEEAQAAQRAVELSHKDDAEVLAELDLPDPSSLKSGDDFSGFMSRDVPEHLRRQALRTLWRSNPVLACVDGLNEYDDDYRAAMLLQEPIKTAYQVGKGMLKHIEEMERKAEAQAHSDTVQEDDRQDTVVAEEDGANKAQDATWHSEAEPAEDVLDDTIANAEAESASAPRHMRFSFHGAAV